MIKSISNKFCYRNSCEDNHAFVLRLILFFVFQFTDCLFLVDDTGADSLDFIQCSIIYQISTYSEDVMNGIRLCFLYY